jgi:O-antigen/teichoic acid export membrane protein
MTALFAGDVASRGVGFLVTVYLARILEPAGFGLVSVGMALLGHLQLLSSPGIQLVETRNTARAVGMDDRRFSGVLTLRFVLSVALFAIALLVLFVNPYDPPVRCVMLWSLASLFPLALATDWYLQGMERMAPIGAARFIGYCVYGIAAWFLVRTLDDVAMAPAAFFLGALVTTGMLWGTSVSLRPMPRLKWDVGLWTQLLRENLPVGMAMFVGQMVMNLPPIVIAATTGTADAGVYNAALKLVFMLLIADRVLNALLLPAFTRVRDAKPADLERMVSVTAKVVITGVILLVLLGNLLSSWGISLVYGVAYGNADPVFRILLLYVGLTLINSIATNVLLASGYERLYSSILVRGSLVLIVAMLILTPLYGSIGTAIGAVVGELVTVLLMTWHARRNGSFPGMGLFIPFLIAGCCSGAAGWLLWPVHPVAATAAATGVLGGLLFVFRVFKSEDIAYVRERLA